MENTNSTEYLILDLELQSDRDLTPLVEHFGDEVFLLFNDEVESVFYLLLEPKYFEKEEDCPGNHVRHFLTLIDTLPLSLRELWNGCHSKIFDFGFKCGFEPYPLRVDLAQETLQGIASIGAIVRITIYPLEKERPS